MKVMTNNQPLIEDKRSKSNQITTVNPSTGEQITTYSAMDKNQVFELV